MIENGVSMTERGKKAERPGVTDERHPVGRHVFGSMKKSAHRSNVMASMQLDWSGINQLFTQISAAFLYAEQDGKRRLDFHINNITDLYMSYMQSHPGTMGKSVDRLNLILFYLVHHMAPDWYRLKFQGERVSESLPGDLLLEQGVDPAWYTKHAEETDEEVDLSNPVDLMRLNKSQLITFVSEQDIEVGERVDITDDDREAFVNILLPECWKRYRDHFGLDQPNQSILLAYMNADIPLSVVNH